MSNRFPYFKNLQSKLDEKRCQVMMSSWELFPSELNNFLDFLKTISITKSIVAELETIIQKEDFSEYNFGGRGMGANLPKLPKEEILKIAFYYMNLNKVIDEENNYPHITIEAAFAGSSTHIEDGVQGFKEQVFLPFYRYVFEKVSDGDFLLYLLYRFKLNVEWFDKERIFGVYNNRKEDDLDKELRKFLFLEGVDYPYSKPSTASGEPDVVLHVQENPLPLEVKVFDPERSYGKSRIIDGLNQVKRYTEDYNSHIGYLVVFNPSSMYLEIGSSKVPPSINIGTKEIFVIVVDTNPNRPTASEVKKPNIVTIAQEDLK